jgi:hypothetical protein
VRFTVADVLFGDQDADQVTRRAALQHREHVLSLGTGDDANRNLVVRQQLHQLCAGGRDRVVVGDLLLVDALAQPQQLGDLVLGAAPVPRHGAFDDLAVAAAEQLVAVVIGGHRPAEVAAEQLAEDVEQDVLVIGEGAVEVEHHGGLGGA